MSSECQLEGSEGGSAFAERVCVEERTGRGVGGGGGGGGGFRLKPDD